MLRLVVVVLVGFIFGLIFNVFLRGLGLEVRCVAVFLKLLFSVQPLFVLSVFGVAKLTATDLTENELHLNFRSQNYCHVV